MSRDPWLSEVFQVDVYRVDGADAPDARGFAYAKVDTSDVERVRALCATGFYVVDVNVTLGRDAFSQTPPRDVRRSLPEDHAEVERIKIEVTDTRQWHRRRGTRLSVRRYGIYYPRTKRISIQNRTAVRGQELAAKTFLDTLLHEWMHHYDS